MRLSLLGGIHLSEEVVDHLAKCLGLVGEERADTRTWLAAVPVPLVALVTPPITDCALAVAAPTAEAALREGIRQQNRGGGKDYGRLLNSLVQRVSNLNAELTETQPTSARGSAELRRVAAGRFCFSQSRFIKRLHDIADSLSGGNCSGTELIWLRAVEVAAREGLLGSVDIRVAPL